MDLESRARRHAALGDPHRLTIVDRLRLSDHTTTELAELTALPGNLLAHHLKVLEKAELIERRPSEGDKRRKYVVLRQAALGSLLGESTPPPGRILFVCTHNSARSQFAAALWNRHTGTQVDSAGAEPAARVHPLAVKVAREFDIDLGEAVPRGYDEIRRAPDVVISVCDRAKEGPMPIDAPRFHWSIPDPVAVGGVEAFRSSFRLIESRIALMSSSPQE